MDEINAKFFVIHPFSRNFVKKLKHPELFNIILCKDMINEENIESVAKFTKESSKSFSLSEKPILYYFFIIFNNLFNLCYENTFARSILLFFLYDKLIGYKNRMMNNKQNQNNPNQSEIEKKQKHLIKLYQLTVSSNFELSSRLHSIF